MRQSSRNIRVLREDGGSRKSGGSRRLKRANCNRYNTGNWDQETACSTKIFFALASAIYGFALKFFSRKISIYTMPLPCAFAFSTKY